MMENLLRDKTILIAGAGGLLGTRLVFSILNQGAKVIAADIDVESMKNRLYGIGVDVDSSNLIFFKLNVTNEIEVKTFFKNLGHFDGAVNATYPRSDTYGKHFFDVSLDSFNQNVSLHLGSAFLFTQQCANHFKVTKKKMSLVNISSIYGVVAPKFEIYRNTPMTMPVEYAAIKSAIQHLSKYVVAYVNDSSFRVNCVSLGGIFDNQPKPFLDAYKEKTHGAGMLNVDDVVGSVLFLLSEQSHYITGQNLIVDDGFSL